MPFPKMSSRVSCFLETVCNCRLFWSNRTPWRKRPVAVGVSPSQDITARGRTDWLCIKVVQSKARCRHFIKERCFHIRMSVVASFFPAMIITHQ